MDFQCSVFGTFWHCPSGATLLAVAVATGASGAGAAGAAGAGAA